ncbi:MAG: HD domain-containing protein [Patescibacteria group bacterium]|jgi:putative hydrolase of HD superfamily
METKHLLNFFFELGILKKVEHEGWRLAGVEHPESVSDHSLRAAQIGFVLAKLEKHKNAFEVCTMIVFHDIAECRTGDVHKVANRYIKRDEETAVKEQTVNLEEIGQEIFSLWQQTENKNSTAGIIAKDADLIEQAITAKEYMENGHSLASDWIKNVKKSLATASAKKIIANLDNIKSTDWWQDLKKID